MPCYSLFNHFMYYRYYAEVYYEKTIIIINEIKQLLLLLYNCLSCCVAMRPFCLLVSLGYHQVFSRACTVMYIQVLVEIQLLTML